MKSNEVIATRVLRLILIASEMSERYFHSEAIYGENQKFYRGKFLNRGYFVSTVGLDDNVVSAYIREQEKEKERYE